MDMKACKFLVAVVAVFGIDRIEIPRNRILLDATRTKEGIVLKVKATQETKLVVDGLTEKTFEPDYWQDHLIPYRYLTRGEYEFSLVGNGESHDYVLSPLLHLDSTGVTSNNLVKERDGSLVVEEKFRVEMERRYSIEDRGTVFSIEYLISDSKVDLDLNPFLVLGTSEDKVGGGFMDLDEGGLILGLESTNSKDFYLMDGYSFSEDLTYVPARIVNREGYPTIDIGFTFRPYRMFGKNGMVVLHEG